jgi:hypothetical protein
MDPVRVPTTTDTQTITRMSTADARSGGARPVDCLRLRKVEVVEPDATRGLTSEQDSPMLRDLQAACRRGR